MTVYKGDEIYTEIYTYGETPVYKGATPIKPANAQHTYVFTGWKPIITAVTCDVTYEPVFNEMDPSYAVLGEIIRRKGSDEKLTVTVKQAGETDRSFDDFTGVFLNKKPLIRYRDFMVYMGSTIIVISPDVLEKLPVRMNTITVSFAFGEVSAEIEILEEENTGEPISPPTGDAAIPLAVSVMTVTAIAITAIYLTGKKEKVFLKITLIKYSKKTP